MSPPDGKTSIWKKEITFRRKPKARGVRVPPAPSKRSKPDSVAELLRPLSEQGFDPAVLPLETPRAENRVLGEELLELDVAVRKPSRRARKEAKRRADRLAKEEQRRAAHVAQGEQTSFWKKEITFRRKPKEKGLPPAPSSKPPAEPKQPTAGPVGSPEEQLHGPVVLPPVTPPVASEAQPEVSAETEPTVETEPSSESDPTTVSQTSEPEQRKPSRRERRQAKHAADRLAKEGRRRAKHMAKEERKAAPAQKRLVGLKVGGSQIAAAQVVNKGGPRVVRMARMPLERGVVVGGELREPEELAAALKTFFRKNKLPRTAVRLGISNSRIGVRTFEISGIEDPRQLANAIRFRAQEALPIPLEEAVLDYRILEDRIGEDGVSSRRVLLVVAHRELVDRYVAACRKAGLKLVGIDLEAFALLRALAGPAQAPTVEDAGLVCISIGHDRSTLAVSNGRVCEFTRVLPWGGSALDVALARVLDVTPSEAEPIKRVLSLADDGETAGLDERRAELARSAMTAELQAFARELVASLRFYQEQQGSLGISEILVTGGGAECGGLAEELERLIGVTVRRADPLGRVKLTRKLRKAAGADAGSLAVALGLGIED
jgi:type IV pilus assembly protein PilM